MSKTIDTLYTDIAQRIVDSIQDEWTEAKISFQYYGDAGEYQGRYIESTSNEERDFSVGYKTYKDLKAIHGITTEGESNRWNRALFTLYSTGKFTMDFQWDQALVDEIEKLSKD